MYTTVFDLGWDRYPEPVRQVRSRLDVSEEGIVLNVQVPTGTLGKVQFLSIFL